MERCCNFFNKFKHIAWTKIAIIICWLPFMLGLFIFMIILLTSVEAKGAIVSNTRICASVGKEILMKKGSAVDAAIGTMICEGISLPDSAGLGGGFTALIRIGGIYDSIAATPTIPQSLMKVKTDLSFLKGAKSAGIPGELMGYWEMHQKYGMLSWKEIIEPSIKLCLEGVPLTEWFAGMVRFLGNKLAASPTMSQIFPQSEFLLYKQDFKKTYPALAETLKKIAKNGVSEFYGGELGKKFIEDIQADGGLITLDDLRNYKVLWERNLPKLRISQRFNLYSTPPPSMGPVIILLLNIIKSVKFDNEVSFWHYFLQAMKYSFHFSLTLGDSKNDPSYAELMTETYKNLTNPDFARWIRRLIALNDTSINLKSKFEMDKYLGKGSLNICVLAPNGDIVVATTGLSETFGAYFVSPKTGIILNNILSRFIEKDGNIMELVKTNRLLPGKHYLTPHSPSVITDMLGRPIFIVGASGGPRAVTRVANAIIKYVIREESAAKAVITQQLFHPLSQDYVEYEEGFDEEVLKNLSKYGYKFLEKEPSFHYYTIANCIGNKKSKPNPQYNIQVGGSTEVFQLEQGLSFILVAIVMLLCITAVGVMLYEVLHPHKISGSSL